MLADLLQKRALHQPNANPIYVVFLGPEPSLHSNLGPMLTGKHYVAYHNFFNASGARFHYVVIPPNIPAE